MLGLIQSVQNNGVSRSADVILIKGFQSVDENVCVIIVVLGSNQRLKLTAL
jgi:hypothetical protein